MTGAQLSAAAIEREKERKAVTLFEFVEREKLRERNIRFSQLVERTKLQREIIQRTSVNIEKRRLERNAERERQRREHLEMKRLVLSSIQKPDLLENTSKRQERVRSLSAKESGKIHSITDTARSKSAVVKSKHLDMDLNHSIVSKLNIQEVTPIQKSPSKINQNAIGSDGEHSIADPARFKSTAEISKKQYNKADSNPPNVTKSNVKEDAPIQKPPTETNPNATNDDVQKIASKDKDYAENNEVQNKNKGVKNTLKSVAKSKNQVNASPAILAIFRSETGFEDFKRKYAQPLEYKENVLVVSY
jgi:hypothetical protein